jgi:hypothetical protein
MSSNRKGRTDFFVNRRVFNVFILGFILMPISAGSASAAGEMLANPGFEGAYSDGIAPSWQKNCYQNNRPTFSQEKGNPHSGRSCQKVVCNQYIDGGIQFFSGGLSIARDKTYTVRIWMKQIGIGGTVTVVLRRHGPPYTSYLTKNFKVTDQWKEYVISGLPSDSDRECGLYVVYHSTGVLWVDDASVQEGGVASKEEAPKISNQAVVKGNLIENSSFELGLYHWAPIFVSQYDQNLTEGGLSLDVENPFHGKKDMKVAAAKKVWDTSRSVLESMFIKIKPNQEYTLSAYLKGAAEGTDVSLSCIDSQEPENPSGIRKIFRVGKEWKRYSVTGVIPDSLSAYYVVDIANQGTSPIFVDGIQLEEGGLSPFAPKNNIEIGSYISNSKTHLYLSGEEVKVKTVVASRSAFPKEGLTLTYRLIDYFDKEVKRWEKKLAPTAASTLEDEISLTPDKTGMYRIYCEAGPENRSEVTFGMVDKPLYYDTPKPDSIFGMHGGLGLNTTDNRLVEIARKMGVKWWRVHDMDNFTQWYKAEPWARGKFVWYDENIDYLLKNNISILGVFCRTPRWAGPDPNNPEMDEWKSDGGVLSWRYPPKNMADFQDYVYQVVSHYKNKIKYWEVWNEPFGAIFWMGAPQQYVDLLKVAYQTAKKADPECKILGGSLAAWTAPEAFTIPMLKAGALNYMDILSYHYGSGETVRGWAKEYGTVKELWCTESSSGGATFYNLIGGPPRIHDYKNADYGIVKNYTTCKAFDVKKSFSYYLGFAGGGLGYFKCLGNGLADAMLEPDGAVTSGVVQYSVMAQLLEDVESKERFNTLADNVECYLFYNPKTRKYLTILWGKNIPIQDGYLTLDAKKIADMELLDTLGHRKEIDWFNNMARIKISDEPVLIRTSSREIINLIKGARFYGVVPKELTDKFDTLGGRYPDMIKEAKYREECVISPDIKAYLLLKRDTPWIVLWNDANKVNETAIKIKSDKVAVYDMFGETVPIGKGEKITLKLEYGGPLFIECKGYNEAFVGVLKDILKGQR